MGSSGPGAGRLVKIVDGHDTDPRPAAFREAVGDVGDEPVVILVDTYELLQPLDDWLREEFVAGLPLRSLVVLAGREPLSAGWSADPGWRGVVRVLRLEGLAPEEAERSSPTQEYRPTHDALISATRGHPLALGLAVDVVTQHTDGHGSAWGPGLDAVLSVPDVVAALVDRFITEVPDDEHRAALAAAVVGRFTTEDSLRAALGADDVRALFGWLRGLSCMEAGRRGLHPHDLARDVLDADLRWRDAQRYRRAWERVRAEGVSFVASAGTVGATTNATRSSISSSPSATTRPARPILALGDPRCGCARAGRPDDRAARPTGRMSTPTSRTESAPSQMPSRCGSPGPTHRSVPPELVATGVTRPHVSTRSTIGLRAEPQCRRRYRWGPSVGMRSR